MLQNPDDFAVVFEGLACTAAVQLLEELTVHLRTTKHVDGVAVINELTFACASDRRTDSALRRLSHAVDEFVASCMEFVADDDREFIVIEFVSTGPLIFGYDFLCRTGADYGLVRGSSAKRLDRETRRVADDTAIKHAIDVWRQRATRAIESGYVMEEGDLFLFLDGLARLGVGATDVDA